MTWLQLLEISAAIMALFGIILAMMILVAFARRIILKTIPKLKITEQKTEQVKEERRTEYMSKGAKGS